jgi:cell division protein FtsL
MKYPVIQAITQMRKSGNTLAKKPGVQPGFRQQLMLGLLVFLILISALGVVATKHFNRSLHIQLQRLQNSKDKLHVEWTQLLLEQGTLGSDVRVEQIAREKLGMITPVPSQMVVIRP